jgi:hypothetical protein
MDAPPVSRETPAAVLEPNIWKEIYHIRTYEVDCHDRLSILSSTFDIRFFYQFHKAEIYFRYMTGPEVY